MLVSPLATGPNRHHAAGPAAGAPATARRLYPARLILPAFALPLAGLVAVPVIAVLFTLTRPADARWAEFAALMLPGYLTTTLFLVLGVSAGAAVLGVGAAWLVACCHFPGHRLCELLLLLPMAMPAYLLAYVYVDTMQYSGRPPSRWRRRPRC